MPCEPLPLVNGYGKITAPVLKKPEPGPKKNNQAWCPQDYQDALLPTDLKLTHKRNITIIVTTHMVSTLSWLTTVFVTGCRVPEIFVIRLAPHTGAI